MLTIENILASATEEERQKMLEQLRPHGKWIIKEGSSALCSECHRNNKFHEKILYILWF